MRVATVAQVAALAEAINPRFRALVLVAAYAGLR
jgi:integrase